MDGINVGANIKAAATAKRPVNMRGQNTNNRDDMSQIAYYNLGK